MVVILANVGLMPASTLLNYPGPLHHAVRQRRTVEESPQPPQPRVGRPSAQFLSAEGLRDARPAAAFLTVSLRAPRDLRGED